MLNEREVEQVLAIAETLNISRAAEHLHISQPALSRSLRYIEAELGISLFDRSTTPLSLTYAGSQYLIYAKKYRELLARLQHDLDGLAKQKQTTLHIGIPSQIANYIFPSAISSFIQHNPDVCLEMKYGSTRSLSSLLKGGKLDLSILSAPLRLTGFVNDLIAYDKILLAVPPMVNISTYLLGPSDEGFAYIDFEKILDKHFFVTEFFYQSSVAPLLDQIELHPHRITFVPNLDLAWDLAYQNAGIAFVMQSMVRHRMAPTGHKMTFCAIDHPSVILHYSLTYPKTMYDSNKHIRHFVDHCHDVFPKHVL